MRLFASLLCAVVALACMAEPAAAQARIGGGGGFRGGGVRAGGGLGASPGRMSGRARSRSSFGAGSTSRSVGARPPGSGTTGLLHPRGYLGSTPQPGPVAPSHPSPNLPIEPAAAPRATAHVGAPLRPQVISVPRSAGIPPVGNSIPPLEPTGAKSRAAARISGYGHRSFQGKHHFTPGLSPHFPVIFVPFGFGHGGYGGYGGYGYTRHNIVVVGHETATRSQTSYQKVPAQPSPPAPPIEPKLYEVRPREPLPAVEPVPGEDPAAAGAPEGSPAAASADSIEMIRGGEVADRIPGDQLYLIAFNNESIVVSRRHWLEGDTLHYVTPSEQHHQVKLADIDLGLTARLNRERGLIFQMEVVPEEY